MRHGQFLFNTANSDLVPITNNHWMACATCHVEGRSDAVTWRFLAGPRDTPSNAGGVGDTGFLLHTADRRAVTDYWQTIDDEQGGQFFSTGPDGGKVETTEQALILDLQDLQTYVNLAIPVPVPPTTDPTLVAAGETLFYSGDVGCSSCHSGPAYTDSGEGNLPGLVLEDKVLLHDVGSCNTGDYPDVDHTDEDGNPRYPCALPAGATCPNGELSCVGFDTPTLRGVAASAPYLHDGSAPTIRDVLLKLKGSSGGALGTGHMGDITNLTDAQLDALVEYVRAR
jgi:mono/diheme cytochrome c family protein